MFEALFTIAAQVESNEQGERVFHISKHGAPANESAFSSLVAAVYQQGVSHTLQAGDTFTITVHLDLPP